MSTSLTVDLSTAVEAGQNIKAVMVGTNLVLVIDTTKSIGPSASGKMTGIGSTSGFAGLPGGLKGNIYIGKKA